ncbi:MAG: HAD-IA family hydrolase [Acidobacteria bacterium]|nr:HAD-IA family hydrolase [Acidobacteriota bacterium]
MKFLKAKPSIELLIFDLDGTLIDSKADLVNSVNATLEYLGRNRLEDETIYSYVGNGAPALIAKALGPQATEREIEQGLDYFLSYYREHKLDNTTLYPGVRETLAKLANGTHSLERIMAVLSNKPVYPSREILSGLGLSSFFRYIYGGNSFDTKKPDPLGLNYILEQAGVEPSAAMMVGDSDVDILTGINAGAWTCAVTHGFGTLSLETIPPDLVVDSLPELADALS